MVRFPDCPLCGTQTYVHAETCPWRNPTPAKIAERVAERVSRRKLPPVITKAALLALPQRERAKLAPGALAEQANIRDVFEGPPVAALAFVFEQLERQGIGKSEEDRKCPAT